MKKFSFFLLFGLWVLAASAAQTAQPKLFISRISGVTSEGRNIAEAMRNEPVFTDNFILMSRSRGADFVITGEVSRKGDGYSVTLSMTNPRNDSKPIKETSFTYWDEEELSKKMPSVARELASAAVSALPREAGSKPAVSLSEQDAKVRDNWLSGEVSLLGVGARYERMLTENWSMGAGAYYNSFFLLHNELEIGAFARYYPWGKTFFASVGLGYHMHSGKMDFTYENTEVFFNSSVSYGSSGSYGTETTTNRSTEWGTISGLSITPEVGWKIDVGEPGGFFLQPGMRLPITLGNKKSESGHNKEEFGAGVGFVAYFGLGYAF